MLIRMTVQLSGTRDAATWPAPGGLVDLPDAEALEVVATGVAEIAPVDTDRTATAPATDEQATTATRRRRS